MAVQNKPGDRLSSVKRRPLASIGAKSERMNRGRNICDTWTNSVVLCWLILYIHYIVDTKCWLIQSVGTLSIKCVFPTSWVARTNCELANHFSESIWVDYWPVVGICAGALWAEGRRSRLLSGQRVGTWNVRKLIL